VSLHGSSVELTSKMKLAGFFEMSMTILEAEEKCTECESCGMFTRSRETVEIPVVTICTTTFNIHRFYVLSTKYIYVFCVYLRINSEYFTVQHLLTGFYNRDGVCLLGGTHLLSALEGVAGQLYARPIYLQEIYPIPTVQEVR
jgi:hypothetical protein